MKFVPLLKLERTNARAGFNTCPIKYLGGTDMSKDKSKTQEVKPDLYKELLEKVATLEKKLNEKKSIPTVAMPRNPAKMTKEQEDFLLEKIPFRAFKDNDKYKDDISVQVNGKIFQIQRGVQVMIPRYVYLALEQSERQLAEAATYEAGLVEQFEGKRAALQ